MSLGDQSLDRTPAGMAHARSGARYRLKNRRVTIPAAVTATAVASFLATLGAVVRIAYLWPHFWGR